MVPRRDFLAWLGATAVVCGRRWPETTDRLDPVGIQLYTLRRRMQEDVEGTLAAVAEIGYREVEFAGYFDRPPKRIRELLEANGLRAPAAHIGMPEPGDGWDRVLDAAAEIGHGYVVTPWIPESQRTADGYRRFAELFNRAGMAARARGITFAYHNHDFEFVTLGDRLPFDLLLDETDPTLVQFELDLFWITKGGHDPLEYFGRYPGRFPLVHVKDMSADGAMVDVGQGEIDFARIFARAAQAGIRHYFVEHDNPADPLESARRSHAHLRDLDL
jgi:sugar phosphate isomerase/epimerase